MKPSTSLKATLLALALTASTAMILSAADPINPVDFRTKIDNPFFPLVPGTTLIYSGLTQSNALRNRFLVTPRTKLILGVACREISNRTFLDGVLVEDTLEWFAQDRLGNVWHFGERRNRLDAGGNVISTAGSWEAGVNGALPGIFMEGRLHVGDTFQHEFAPGVAEDRATVISLRKTVTVPFGKFINCLQTTESSPLEPGTVRNKFYAPGIGLIQSVTISGSFERLQLVSILRTK